jgi:hypothetical protein
VPPAWSLGDSCRDGAGCSAAGVLCGVVGGRQHACPVASTGFEQRPLLTPALSGAELLRWYWLKEELVVLARTMGVGTGGGKVELTARLAATLDGVPPPPTARRSVRAVGKQLLEPLTRDSVIPPGQRCSEHLRRFMVAAVGPAFRFDGPMRRFVAEGAGRTLGEAVDHWWASRSGPKEEIASQFELNRFVREWHRRHPGARRSDALAAWREHRALPIDCRH